MAPLQSSTPGKAKTGILVSVIAATCFAIFALLPGPTRPDVSIKFVGRTNNLAGAQVGVISVTNLGTARRLTYAPCIEVRAPTEPGGIACYGNTGHWGSILGGGRFRKFCHSSPTCAGTVIRADMQATLLLAGTYVLIIQSQDTAPGTETFQVNPFDYDETPVVKRAPVLTRLPLFGWNENVSIW